MLLEPLRTAASRMWALFTGRRREADLRDEIDAHLDLLVTDFVRQGMTATDARVAARRAFGGVDQIKEDYRDRRGVPIVETLVQDVRFGLRSLRKTPLFSLTAAAVLAIGIGANATVFTIVNALLLRPLPFRHSEDIVRIRRRLPQGSSGSFSMHDYVPLRAPNDALAALAILDVVEGARYNLVAESSVEAVSGLSVSAQFFSVFDAAPIAGRLFADGDDVPGGPGLAVLSQGFWQRRFGGDPSIVGSSVTLTGRRCTIVGIAPESMRAFTSADVFLILPVPPSSVSRTNGFQVLARIAPGLSLPQAEARVDAVARHHAATSTLTNMPQGVVLRSLQDELVGSIRTPLEVLLAAVGLVLLVACSNVANLSVARGLARRREIAVMAALGASRARIMRRVIVEHLIVAAAGGTLGLGVAYAAVRALPFFQAGWLPMADRIAIDPRLFGFVAGAAAIAGSLAGLAPALQISRTDLTQWLKQGSSQGGAGGAGNRVRALLTLAQVALSTVLLAGAGLLVRSFWNLATVDPGFRAERVLTTAVKLTPARYRTAAEVAAYTASVTDRIERLGGVLSASSTTSLPAEFPIDFPVAPVGSAGAAGQRTELDAWFRAIDPHFFDAMGIPLISGRAFDAGDNASGAPVVIINRSLARAAFPGGAALGRGLVIGAGYLTEPRDLRPRTVVGIVGDTREQGLRFAPTMTMYLPVAQTPELITQLVVEKIPVRWVIRTSGDPIGITSAVRQAVLAVDPTQPPSGFATLDDLLARSIATARFSMSMLAAFAGLALALAAIGVYGLTAYAVVQRTREIGIRLSLGASPRRVVRGLVWEGLRICAIGAGVGVAGSLALGRFLRTLLFGIGAADATTFAAVVAALTIVVAIASYLPAARAAAIDPIRALRDE